MIGLVCDLIAFAFVSWLFGYLTGIGTTLSVLFFLACGGLMWLGARRLRGLGRRF